MGDHLPKHVHVYKDGHEIAKVQVPEMIVLTGKVNARLRKILDELVRRGMI